MPLPAPRRDPPAYRLTAVKSQPPPPGLIIHFLSPRLTVLCSQPNTWKRPKTKVPEKVTCPACLKKMKSLEGSHD